MSDQPVALPDDARVAWAVMMLWRGGQKNTAEIPKDLTLPEAQVAEIIHSSRERMRNAASHD